LKYNDINDYKIGKSHDAVNRVSELQTGNSTPLKLIASFKTYDYTLLEKILHNTFKNNNILREWFKFEPQILHEVLSIMYNACVKVNKESDFYEEPIINNIIKNNLSYKNSQGKTEHKCNDCGKIFNQKCNYERHLKRKIACTDQITDSTLTCDTCNKIFAHRSSLYNHKKKSKCITMIVNNTIGNKTIDNITNNIDKHLKFYVDNVKVVKFGNEDISYISDNIMNNDLDKKIK